MEPHQFHARFASTPLNDRFKIVNFGKYGTMTLFDMYKRICKIEDEIRPKQEEINNLCDDAYYYFKELDKQGSKRNAYGENGIGAPK